MSIVKFFSIAKEYVSESRFEGTKMSIGDFSLYYKVVREDLARAKFRIVLDIGEQVRNGKGFTKEELKAEYQKEGIHVSDKEIDALFEELIYLD